MQVDNTNINAVTVSRKKLMDEIDEFDLIVMKEKLSPSISRGTRYFGSKSCYKRMNNGFDYFYAEFPVNKAPASSVGKKELQKRSNFVYDVSEYVASSSKEKSETKLLLTELVRIHKLLFQETFADSGLDTSVSMTPTEAVSMQYLLRLPTNKVRNLRHILSNVDMNILPSERKMRSSIISRCTCTYCRKWSNGFNAHRKRCKCFAATLCQSKTYKTYKVLYNRNYEQG